MWWYLALFFITWFGVWRIRQFALAKGVIDVPNERSSHSVPTPRGGGAAFVVVFAATTLAQFWSIPALLFLRIAIIGALAVSILSFTDDLISLGAKKRLFAQLLICAGVLFSIFSQVPLSGPVLWSLLTVGTLGTVWFLNLYNFMDGTDGLAALEGVFILAPMGGLFGVHQMPYYSIVCFSLSACLAGFLTMNWPKAKIFMGDVGSTFLGFFIAAMAILSALLTPVSFWYWVLLSTCFWLDATVTLFRRLLNNEPITQAHCTHAYQRLYQSGWSHAKLLLGLGLVNLLWVSLALASFMGLFTPLTAACIALLIGMALLWAIEKKQPRIIRKP